VIWELLAADAVCATLIVDGHHLPPSTVKAMVRAKGTQRTILVTDAIAAAGTDERHSRLSGVEVEIRDGVARRPDGVLAGSVLTMIEAFRNLHGLGVPLVDAVAAATAVPARAARRPELGVLRPGVEADLVVLDDRLELTLVLRAGRERLAA
jgi:N-acetylglucosamine-6-phosphate deacetylase